MVHGIAANETSIFGPLVRAAMLPPAYVIRLSCQLPGGILFAPRAVLPLIAHGDFIFQLSGCIEPAPAYTLAADPILSFLQQPLEPVTTGATASPGRMALPLGQAPGVGRTEIVL